MKNNRFSNKTNQDEDETVKKNFDFMSGFTSLKNQNQSHNIKKESMGTNTKR